MSHVAFEIDDAPATLPFLVLVETLLACDVSFRRRGDDLALKNGGVLTAELKAAVADHKAALLALCDLRAEFSRLLDMITRLRYEAPKKGTWTQATQYVQVQINRLAKRCDLPCGYADPIDPFADEALMILQEDLSELVAYGKPYPAPLPDGCTLLPQANFDPFEHGRNYAGKVIGDELTGNSQ